MFALFVPLVGGSHSIRRLLLAAACAVPGWFIILGSRAVELLSVRYIGADAQGAGAVLRLSFLLATVNVFFLLFYKTGFRNLIKNIN